ncbi:MAG TPA: hypothetical protein ENG87_02865 [Candidatus Pacearchaeota archaeon]|nr:hypothetical protein [Candidatus Pacearchaeota archaeon]
MGLFNKFKSLWGSTERAKKTPHSNEEIIKLCMGDICSSLVKHLSNDYYSWNEEREIKTFECLILSKFIMTHAMQSSYKEFNKTNTTFYSNIIDHYFISLLRETFKDRFSYDKVKEHIDNRVDIYNSIVSNEPHPRMWQIIAGTCTGIDYYSQENLETLVSSSTMLPELLIHSQDSLKLVIPIIEENGYVIIPCLSCGTKNKIKSHGVTSKPICGKCQSVFSTWN